MRRLLSVTFLLCIVAFTSLPGAVPPAAVVKPQPLSSADIDAIAHLLKLEDTRAFDEAVLTSILHSTHPEVRRRAVMSVGRIVNPQGRALLVAMRQDADPEVVASVAFASGQLKDPDAVAWLGEILASPKTPPAIAKEAACALGKIRTPEALTALDAYLNGAPITSATSAVAGEALLSVGRFTPPPDIAPVVRWITAKDDEVRWRAAWALFRSKAPAAIPHLLTMSKDASAEVRFWAVRGLAPAVVDQSGGDRAVAATRLREATKDADRRVRTEALRALTAYNDDASFAVVLANVDSSDTWMSVSAAESLGRFQARRDAVVPKLIEAAGPAKPLSLRITALAPLVTLAPDAALDVAGVLAKESSATARTTAIQALGRLGAPGRTKLDTLAGDPAIAALIPPVGGRGGGGRGQTPAPRPVVADAEYRRIVEKSIVPDYNGSARPRVILDTPRGTIEIELYPGDAPMGVEYLEQMVSSGAIVGTEFGRVVPNFVAQQRTIRSDPPLRDEVNRHGLTRGNLSWASSGLDTGRPGYTLGSTPQPHNEGDFTALGRVIRGLDVVDHLELADRITAAKIVR